MDIILDRNSDKPLYVQIRDYFITEVNEGRLETGNRIPAVSILAKQTGVTQSTILRAFEDLTKLGYLVSHVGRGSFITKPQDGSLINPDEVEPGFIADAKSRVKQPNTFLRSPVEPFDPDLALAARKLRMGAAKSLESLQVLSKRPGLIHFTSGIPDPAIMEEGLLEKMALEALKKGQSAYQGYIEPMGLLELRELIAERYRREGTDITADNIIITSGSQQAISIVSQYSLENCMRVLCETPCYQGVSNAFGAVGHWVDTVARDKEGPLPERLPSFREDRKTIFYLCPEMHNPMGTDLSPDRRKILLEWGRENNVLFLSDEIYHDLRLEKSESGSLMNGAGLENIITVGSLSKTFMCGLRIGWLITGRERIQCLTGLKRAMDIGCSSLMQGIAASIISSGKYDENLLKAKEHYRVRRDAALESLKKFMPSTVKWTKPAGGFQMWLELPQGYSSISLYLLAVERGVAITPGPQMDVDHRFVNGFRLCYGSVEVPQIREGVELLAEAVKELLKSPPSETGLSGLGDFI